MEWPTPLCSVAGATTVTSPRREEGAFHGGKAGGEDAVVVREEDLHGGFFNQGWYPASQRQVTVKPTAVIKVNQVAIYYIAEAGVRQRV